MIWDSYTYFYFWKLVSNVVSKFVFFADKPDRKLSYKKNLWKSGPKKYQKSPPYYHLEFIIRYDNKKIGAFNQSNQKKIFRFFSSNHKR